MRGWIQVGVVVAAACLLAGETIADGDSLKRAVELRDASAEDWRNKNYAEAAQKLRQAEAIYDALGDESPLADHATTIRALVWNEKLAGQNTEAGASYVRLIGLVKGAPDHNHEAMNAWSAIFQIAQAMPSFDEAQAFLATIQAAADDAGMKKLAAQVAHSTGSVASEKGSYQAAIGHLEDAIDRRRDIGDDVGLTWSLNNLANLHLADRGDLPAGMKPLVEAHKMVHERRVLEPQAAVAWNVRKALDMADAYEGKLDPIFRGIDAMIRNAEKSDTGEAVTQPELYRRRLALVAKGGGAGKTEKAANALVKAKLTGYPGESRADLVLVAAETVLDAEKGGKVPGWLGKIQCGDGPTAVHLEARRETANALAAAARKKKKDFATHATAAAGRWKELKDWQGERAALGSIVEAAEAREYSADISDVVERWNAIRQDGKPGGSGGSASSSGNRDAYQHLSLSDALFELSFVDGKLLLEDKAAGQKREYEVAWRPRNVGVNGLALKIFGGYVVVTGLDYGGAASASGAPGATTLAELGDYLPVPSTGALVIQKNGAIRYRLR